MRKGQRVQAKEMGLKKKKKPTVYLCNYVCETLC